MAKWEQLIAARERKHLSQAEAAERVNVGLVTYQRWELGKRKPQPQHMRHLCEVFEMLLEQEEVGSQEVLHHMHDSDLSSFPLPWEFTVGPKEGNSESQAPVAGTMTTYLWSFAFMDHPTCNNKRTSIRQAIKEFDSMNTDNKNYQITRREALCSLAALPIITLGLATPGKVVPATQYSNALAQCAASLEACWELRKSDDTSDRLLALQCATKYVPTLTTIARHSPQYRNEALDLATRYTLIKAFVARHFTSLSEAIQDGINAVALSKETGDIPLQLYAYSSLAWSYLFSRNYPLALTAMLEAETLLRQSTQNSSIQPLHIQIQGRTYSTLAITQAKNGKSTDNALGKATEIDPGNESAPFLDFKQSILFLEAGTTYCYQGDQTKAMEWFEKRIDPETLEPRIAQSGLGRVEAINLMTLSSLRAKNRDMEKTLHLWMHGMKGAIALRSEQRFNEAVATYELMEVVWPGEKRITDLRDHIVHWEE